MKLPRAPESITRLESVQDDRKAEKTKQLKNNQKIQLLESKERENEQKISAVNNLFKVSQRQLNNKRQNKTLEIFNKMNHAYSPANYKAAKMLQKVIQLVKTREGAKISRLPAPWREKFNTFSVEQLNY